MRQCNRCERATKYKLCPECVLEDRFGVPSDGYDGEVSGERRYRCRACGGEFVAEPSEDCPHCGERNRQFIDYVDGTGGSHRLIADGGEPMERVTVRVPDDQLDALDALVEISEYASRSAVVRDGIQTLVDSRGESA